MAEEGATKTDGSGVVAERCARVVQDGFVCLSVAVGWKLGLFNALFEHSSDSARLTPTELAQKTCLKERYVREWLGAMACARLVEVDAEGLRYWIAEGDRTSYASFGLASFLPQFSDVFRDILGCFKPDGPGGLPYSSYAEFHTTMSEFSSKSAQATVDCMLKYARGLSEGLAQGGLTSLDLGCGKGAFARCLARQFPQSQVWGMDFEEEAILAARADAPAALTNLHYEAMDAVAMRDDWSSKFDLVTAIDSIHDQARPDLAIKEVFRVLKPGGRFVMIDIHGYGNVREDMEKKGLDAALMYSISLLHCMPVSLYFDGGMGLGTMWGSPKARQLLGDAGFVEFEEHVLPSEGTVDHVHYLCRKPPVDEHF